MKVKSPRIILEPLKKSDIESLLELLTDPEVTKHIASKESTDTMEKIQAGAKDLLSGSEESWQSHGYGLWSIRVGDSGIADIAQAGEFIGYTGYWVPTIEGLGPETGTVIAKKYWGIGLALEIARLKFTWLFNNTNFQCLYGIFKQAQLATAQLVKKERMKFLKTIDDVTGPIHIYTLKKEDYLSKNQAT